MPGKLIATRGLPGCGKTFWSLAQVAAAPVGEVVRANRDDIRAMLYGPDYSTPVHAAEQHVTAVQRATVERFLADGRTVILDDTNLRLKYLREWANLAAKLGAEFEVVDFLDVPVETCVARDANRRSQGGRFVGPDVIRGMHDRFLRGKGSLPVPVLDAPEPVGSKPYTGTPGAPKAIIVDIDGTVALHGERNPYDTSRYDEDGPNEPVIEQVRLAADAGYVVLFTSGRSEEFFEVTAGWIARHVIAGYPQELIMRKAGDVRNDAVVKLELFDQHIRDRFDVRWVLDDRNRVVEAWRSIGLSVMQVAPGDF